MTLNQVELALAQIIMGSPNPDETARIATDVFFRRAEGESMERIAASYGLDWEKIRGGVTSGSV